MDQTDQMTMSNMIVVTCIDKLCSSPHLHRVFYHLSVNRLDFTAADVLFLIRPIHHFVRNTTPNKCKRCFEPAGCVNRQLFVNTLAIKTLQVDYKPMLCLTFTSWPDTQVPNKGNGCTMSDGC